MVTGGFWLTYLLRVAYGGSMAHADGTEKLLLGINIGVLGFGLVVLIAVLVLRRESTANQ